MSPDLSNLLENVQDMHIFECELLNLIANNENSYEILKYMIYLEPDLIEIDLLKELFKFNQLDAQTLINMKLLDKKLI